MRFGGMYSLAFAVVVRHNLAESGINSIPGGDVFHYSSAWDNSAQCSEIPSIPGGTLSNVCCQSIHLVQSSGYLCTKWNVADCISPLVSLSSVVRWSP